MTRAEALAMAPGTVVLSPWGERFRVTGVNPRVEVIRAELVRPAEHGPDVEDVVWWDPRDLGGFEVLT